MRWKKWEELPKEMQNPQVRPYYDLLLRKRGALGVKRVFDVVAATVLLLVLWPVMAILALLIAVDSPGGVFFRQERVTRYGKVFRIHKFRTMVTRAECMGSQVTEENDKRITKIGSFLRKCRLDELPQLLDVLTGNMSFVGTRPEVPGYVKAYTPEMYATLLLPAGITSRASILFKDEGRLLTGAEDVDRVYIEKVLPEKMVYNLQALKDFSLFGELKIMLKTVVAVFEKE